MKAMYSIIGGKDTFVSLPTGYGKSVIFAALPMAFDQLKGELKLLYECTYIYTPFSVLQEHLEALYFVLVPSLR